MRMPPSMFSGMYSMHKDGIIVKARDLHEEEESHDPGLVKIDIVGKLVFEELLKYHLEKGVRDVLEGNKNNNENDYDIYRRALEILK